MNKSREQRPVVSRIVRSLAIGTAVGILFGVLVLLAAAAVMAAIGTSAAVTPVALSAIALAAFVGGFTAARLLRERGLLIGAACGALLFAVTVLGGLGVDGTADGVAAILKPIIAVGFGALGGVSGVNLKRK